MPLHLLGKKSWNVYNHDNVERVRRDEAAAEAAEAAEDQRMQELDAARRTAILRGETPPPLPREDSEEEKSASKKRTREDDDGDEGSRSMRQVEREERRKKRRLRGEDDTDRDMRLARADMETGDAARSRLQDHNREKSSRREEAKDTPIVDSRGNIRLFDEPEPEKRSGPKARREEERERRKKEDVEGGMRFSNAAGYKTSTRAPWYASNGDIAATTTTVDSAKDVWGNVDPSRRQRDQARTSTNDPMAFMQRAQTQLRQAKEDRGEWEWRRAGELAALEKEQEREDAARRRRRRERYARRKRSVDSLEGFSLDGPVHRRKRSGERDEKHGHAHRHRHRDSTSRHEREHKLERRYPGDDPYDTRSRYDDTRTMA